MATLPLHRKRADVVIAGGGVAALEGALALRALAGDGVRLTLLAPAPDFVYRPWAVAAASTGRQPRRLSLERFAADVNAKLAHGGLATVDPPRRTVGVTGGESLSYDALLVAIGARPLSPATPALLLQDATMHDALGRLLADVETGAVRSIAFVVPAGPTWPQPAYEVALLTRQHALQHGMEVSLTLVTAEATPLAMFGSVASAGVAELLAGAEIDVVAGVEAQIESREVVVLGDGRQLRVGLVVSLPRLVGPAIDGLPADADGFLPTTAHGEVIGVEGVFAAGDATDYPIKQGGVGTGFADAAADSIATLLGHHRDPQPFNGQVSAMLLVGRERAPGGYAYLSAQRHDGTARSSRFGTTSTSSPVAKIAARHLGPYLARIWQVPPPGDVDWHGLSFTQSDVLFP